MTMHLLITPAEACRAWEEVGGDLSPDAHVVLTHGQVEDRDRLTALLAESDAVVLGLERVDGALLDRVPRVRVISRFGVGYDAVDVDAVRARGVRLTNTPGSMAPAVARQALTFLLAMTFNLPEHGRRLAAGEWVRLPNRSCFTTTVGILGYGPVGREFARLAQAVGYRVAVFSRTSHDLPGTQAASPEALVEAADIVSLHMALTAETRGFVSAPLLRRFDGRSLINTARGALVDEAAVLEALDEGWLRYYATDVYAREPVEDTSAALCRHPRVIATPHVAAMDSITAQAMLRQAVTNALAALRGEHERVCAYVV